MKMGQDFDRDLTEMMRSRSKFAFVRFNDGEFRLCVGLSFSARSGWKVKGETWIKEALNESLKACLDGYYVGISPPCCLSQVGFWMRRQVTLPESNVTFGTLLSNTNFTRARSWIRSMPDKVVVGPQGGNGVDIPVPRDGVSVKWDMDAVVEKMLAQRGKNIVVAAGPCANILIHRYWSRVQEPDRCTAIDIGSLLDVDVLMNKTRMVHSDNDPSRGHKCDWKAVMPYEPVTPRWIAREKAKDASRTQFLGIKAAPVNKNPLSRKGALVHGERSANPVSRTRSMKTWNKISMSPVRRKGS